MVHLELDVMGAYCGEILRKLTAESEHAEEELPEPALH